MTRKHWQANWDDQMAQQSYAIYDQNGEEIGLFQGHDAEHAISKFAQYEECDPLALKAELAWPSKEQK